MNVTFNVATVDAYGEPCPTCQVFSSNGYADWYLIGDTVAISATPPILPPPISAVPEPEIILSLSLGVALLYLKRRGK